MKYMAIGIALLCICAGGASAADIEVISKEEHKTGIVLDFQVFNDLGVPVGRRKLNFPISMSSTKIKAILRAEAQLLLNAASTQGAPADLSDIVNKRVPIDTLPTTAQAAALEK